MTAPTAQQRVGCDIRSRTLYVASAREETGRLHIARLQQYERSQEPTADSEGTSRCFVLPDSDGIVKPIILPTDSRHDIADLARFELTQGMLDPEEQFHTDVYPTELAGRFLGALWRHERITQALGDIANGDLTQLRFFPRSVALARGYLKFCRPPEGNLHLLLDFSSDGATVCLLRRRQLLDTATLEAPATFADTQVVERFCADLKTLVGFRLSTLVKHESFSALSAIIVSGDRAPAPDCLQPQFAIPVSEPQIHQGYFEEELATESIAPWLAALGAIVN
ncbi:MAG: hypothetical protein D6800_04910 [Candidatus Zixiibacteriota bacterium]|nr:MAG: hypothetical protein D6800_04910 [candidate division Zixibacteria bacterium]